jgi:hypothetical protein
MEDSKATPVRTTGTSVHSSLFWLPAQAAAPVET